jgi:hypothetical protein
MSKAVVTVLLTIFGFVFVFLVVASTLQHAEDEGRCKRAGGKYVQVGRNYQYLCLSPGIVIE